MKVNWVLRRSFLSSLLLCTFSPLKKAHRRGESMPKFSSSNWQCCFAGNSYSKMQDIRDVSRQPCPLWPHLSQVETWMHSTTDGCQSWVHSAVYFQKSGCQSRTQREGCLFLNPSSHRWVVHSIDSHLALFSEKTNLSRKPLYLLKKQSEKQSERLLSIVFKVEENEDDPVESEAGDGEVILLNLSPMFIFEI